MYKLPKVDKIPKPPYMKPPKNYEWPCEHIDREHRINPFNKKNYHPWIYDGGSKVSKYWICCPECGARRPLTDDEIELISIFKKHDKSYENGIEWKKAIIYDILKWKMGIEYE